MMDEPAESGRGVGERRPRGDGKPAASRSRLFSPEELARCDGQEGRPAYVAYRGFVFDVSHSPLWKGGIHQKRHRAGRDLTEEFAAAPHGRLVLARVPIIGRMTYP